MENTNEKNRGNGRRWSDPEPGIQRGDGRRASGQRGGQQGWGGQEGSERAESRRDGKILNASDHRQRREAGNCTARQAAKRRKRSEVVGTKIPRIL